LSMPDQFMNHKIRRACHALALEEARDAFKPVLWDDRYVRDPGGLVPVGQGWTPARPPESGKPHIDDERISQVWFVGVHSDIGGGYSRAGLAYWTLTWMIERAKVYGLTFQQSQEESLRPLADPYDKLNDSRHGLGGYYRYRPRRLSAIYNKPPYKLSLLDDFWHIVNLWNGRPDSEREVRRELVSPASLVARPAPKIHQSVLDRITKGTDGYAPIVLPEKYSVLDNDGFVAADGAGASAASRALRQEMVWDWVWARRVTYFLTVFATFFLVALPLIDKWNPGSGPVGPAEVIVPLIDLFAIFAPLINLVGALLPSFIEPWLDAFRNAPDRFLGGALAVGILMYVGNWVQGHIRDRMRQIWRTLDAPAQPPSGFVHWLRTAGPVLAYSYLLKHWIIPSIFAWLIFVCLASVIVGLANRVSFAVLDLSGQLCTPTPNPGAQPVITVGNANFDTAKPCTATGLAVQRGKTDRISLVVTEPWEDGHRFNETDPNKAKGIPTDPQGFGVRRMRWQMALGLPIRRLVGSNWFATVLRIGKGEFGDIVLPFEKDSRFGTSFTATFTARKSGELFVYVNDAVIGIPGYVDTFYKNNKGKADLILQVIDE
jgi:hypothetical protein